MVYQPEEDSYLVSKEVKKYISSLNNKKIKILDIGTGSGIQSKACIESGIQKNNILAIDIDTEAIKESKKLGVKTRVSDLFSKIKREEKFDLIIFNPPYLPEDKNEKGIDTTAGKKGYELILKFLKQSKNYLRKRGIIILLFSSLSKPKIIIKEAKKLGYNLEKLAEEKLFFEKLFVYSLRFNP